MPPTLFNPDSELVENFRGHVEIKDGVTWFKDQSILSWSILTRADSEKHYGTGGSKKKTSLGNSSSFQLVVKKGIQWFDTNGGGKVRTINYFKQQIHATPPVIPELTLRGVSETSAASDEFLVEEFVAYVEDIDELRIEGKAVEEIVISGEIKSIVNPGERQETAP